MTQTYMLVNRHTPEQCEAMDAAVGAVGERLRGRDFYCTCPFGEHGFYLILEDQSSEAAIEALPPGWRPGTRAIPLEVFKLPG
jgi:hypothetical protein